MWWSTDDGVTWTDHDYGTGVTAGSLYGRIVIKDGVETMLMAERDTDAAAVCMWATAAFPPVRTTFSVSIRGCSVGHAYDGEPLLCGDRADPSGGGQFAKVARYVGGIWETIIVYPSGYPNGATCGSICKTSNGTYVAGFGEWYRNQTWVRRSTDFTTWDAEQDITGMSSPTNNYGMSPGPSGIVVNMHYGSGVTTLRHSLDNGATWVASVNPAAGYEYKTEYSTTLGLFIRTSGNTVVTSPDGITWTVHDVGQSVGLITDMPVFGYSSSSESSLSSSSESTSLSSSSSSDSTEILSSPSSLSSESTSESTSSSSSSSSDSTEILSSLSSLSSDSSLTTESSPSSMSSQSIDSDSTSSAVTELSFLVNNIPEDYGLVAGTYTTDGTLAYLDFDENFWTYSATPTAGGTHKLYINQSNPNARLVWCPYWNQWVIVGQYYESGCGYRSGSGQDPAPGTWYEGNCWGGPADVTQL